MLQVFVNGRKKYTEVVTKLYDPLQIGNGRLLITTFRLQPLNGFMRPYLVYPRQWQSQASARSLGQQAFIYGFTFEDSVEESWRRGRDLNYIANNDICNLHILIEVKITKEAKLSGLCTKRVQITYSLPRWEGSQTWSSDPFPRTCQATWELS